MKPPACKTCGNGGYVPYPTDAARPMEPHLPLEGEGSGINLNHPCPDCKNWQTEFDEED